MISDKKRVTVMLHDRLTGRLITIAEEMKIPTNELANRFIEGCIQQIEQDRRPADPSDIVKLVRDTLRRNLSAADWALQRWLESHVDGWAKKTLRWRELVLDEVNLAGEAELTKAVVEAARKRADKRWRAENKKD